MWCEDVWDAIQIALLSRSDIRSLKRVTDDDRAERQAEMAD